MSTVLSTFPGIVLRCVSCKKYGKMILFLFKRFEFA